jgi:hypothetical protein
MKNINQILQEKERRIEQLRTEIQALRIVAPLMSEAPSSEKKPKPASAAAVPTGDELGLYLDEPAR